jgi:ABC-type transport system substrate-binding protein
VIGVAANDPTSVAVANTAADQLRNAGVAASVLTLDPVALYGEALADNRFDAVIGWHRAGGDLATLLASRYGCPALQSRPRSTPAGLPLTPPAAPPTDKDPTPTNAPSTAPESGELVQAPSNLTQVCDPGIQASIDAALDGSKSIGEVIETVEPRLWNLWTVLPILQDTTIVAAGPSVRNVSLTGAVPVGIVGDAGQWAKVPR